MLRIIVTGGILAPGRRTVTAALCVMGLSPEPHWCFEPQVLVSTHRDQTPEPILTWCIRQCDVLCGISG
jgi:hypothetical protein